MTHDGRHSWLEVRATADRVDCRLVVMNADLCRELRAESAAALDERDYFARFPREVEALVLPSLRFFLDEREASPTSVAVSAVNERSTYFRTAIDFSIERSTADRRLTVDCDLFAAKDDHETWLLLGEGGEPHVVHLFRRGDNSAAIELPTIDLPVESELELGGSDSVLIGEEPNSKSSDLTTRATILGLGYAAVVALFLFRMRRSNCATSNSREPIVTSRPR